MDGYTLATIPEMSLSDGVKRDQINPEKIFDDWLSKLGLRLAERSYDDISELFIDNCWWRDVLTFSWNLTSKHGQENISGYLKGATNSLIDLVTVKIGALKPVVVEFGPKIWVQAGFTFKNPYGEGRGVVRLANVGESTWKAWTVSTQLEQLNFQKDLEARRTEHPGTARNGVVANGVNGHGDTKKQDVQVLVIGAAQSGLALGARLSRMRISTLLVDRHARLGDSWRQRYKTIALHTPTYTDHYPFMKYPESWPRYLEQDQIADFMEHYGKMMDLDVSLNTTVTKTSFDESTRLYTVEMHDNEGTRTLTARHIVLATGIFNDAPKVPEHPGQESFQGKISHSSEYVSAGQISQLSDKKVAVVGVGPSGHDVAQDFVNHGAKEVSMVQRHGVFSLSTKAFETVVLGLWNTPGISTEEADAISASLPLAVVRRMSINMTRMTSTIDKEMIDGLQKAGLEVKTGEDGYGLADHQLIKGGQFYIDEGANQMIIDGRIQIKKCEEGIKDFQPNGFTLADGTKVEADVVVLATGFHRNLLTVEQLMGKHVADKTISFGQLDEEQERGGWWRPTGTPGFWYMTGSFLWSRQFSLALALQIAAVEKGLNEDHYNT